MKKEITQEQKVKAIQALAIALKKKRQKELGLDTEPSEEKNPPPEMKKEITQEQKVKAIQALAIALKKKRQKELGLDTDEQPTK